jgi:hypothetical protein
VVAPHPVGQNSDVLGPGVVHLQRDPAAAGGGDQLGGLLDGLGAVHRGAPVPGAAAGDVDGGAGGAQLDGDSSACSPRGAGDDGDLSDEGSVSCPIHGTPPDESKQPFVY